MLICISLVNQTAFLLLYLGGKRVWCNSVTHFVPHNFQILGILIGGWTSKVCKQGVSDIASHDVVMVTQVMIH